MRPFVGILGLGAAVAILQGLLGTFVPQHYCPDFGLLLVVGLGLSWRGFASGLFLSAFLGFLTDFLSGSLLGQHGFLRMSVYLASRLGSRHLSLLGPLPLACFVAALTAANAAGMAVLTSTFTAGLPLDGAALTGIVPQMLLNALFAAPVAAVAERATLMLSDDENARRMLNLETRGRTA